MTITLREVTKVASLASLKINDTEAGDYLKKLRDIIALANQMDEIPTELIPAAAHCFDVIQRLRDDKVTRKNRRNRLQQLTTHVESGLYCVPPVIE